MTFDEARMMFGVNHRAQHLFIQGYRVRRQGDTACVRTPHGVIYRLDLKARTCDCPFFVRWSGRHECKHLIGVENLERTQRACRRAVVAILMMAWADLDDGCGDGPPRQDLLS